MPFHAGQWQCFTAFQITRKTQGLTKNKKRVSYFTYLKSHTDYLYFRITIQELVLFNHDTLVNQNRNLNCNSLRIIHHITNFHALDIYNNNVHLSGIHQRLECSHDTYDILYTCRAQSYQNNLLKVLYRNTHTHTHTNTHTQTQCNELKHV